MDRHYDRSAEDLGNIVALEHVNLQVEDQGLATMFYVNGLGLTRDPHKIPEETDDPRFAVLRQCAEADPRRSAADRGASA